MKLVIKIGTSTLAYSGGGLNFRATEELCKVISDLHNSGIEVIIVSSGAVAMGRGKLNIKERPADIPTKQACAAVGQCELMYNYDRIFSVYNQTTAQILITADDIDNTERHHNFSVTLNKLLDMGVIPVINENDTLATAEMGIGDNDTLSAIVATSIGADLLILLSDIDGLYDSDPRTNKEAKLISEVREINDYILSLGGESESGLGTGGMRTKLSAAQRCTAAGCDMVIANGANPKLLYEIAEGKTVGTRFFAKR